jgi:hypothetical protein
VSLLLLLTGIILIGLTAYDMLATTILLRGGGGPLSGRISTWLWKRVLRLHRRSGSHRLLSWVVWFMLLFIVALWVLVLLAGWSFIFNADTDAVLNTSTGQPAGVWDRIYFAGFSLTTLGVGDYSPQGTVWQLVTILAAASGFTVFTLIVSYFLPLVSAGVQKRQLALSVSGLGETPQQILVRAWRDGGFAALTPHVTPLSSSVSLYAEQHFAYPVLHYFHSEDPAKTDALAVVKLDEVLTILEHGMKLENPIDPLTFHSLRRAISSFLAHLQASYIHAEDEVPPVPNLAELRAAGLPVVDDEVFEEALEALVRRRSLLLALVRHTGWSWDHVVTRSSSDDLLA